MLYFNTIHSFQKMFLLILFAIAINWPPHAFSQTEGVLENPILQTEPAKIDAGRMEQGTQQEIVLSLKNGGKGILKWKVESDSPWLTFKRNDLLEGSDDSSFTGSVQPMPRAETMKMFKDFGDSIIRGSGSSSIHIVINATDLPEGATEGSVIIESNGGNRQIPVSINVVTLKKLSISPVKIKMRPGHKRLFKTVGTWSDGSRSDLSGSEEGQWILSDQTLGRFLTKKPFFAASQKEGVLTVERLRGDLLSNTAIVIIEEYAVQPVLQILEREVEFGTIGYGELSKKTVALKNLGSGQIQWSIKVPEGWITNEQTNLYNNFSGSTGYLRIMIRPVNTEEKSAGFSKEMCPVELKIETENNSVSFRKNFAFDIPNRERFQIDSNAGTRNIFLSFTVSKTASQAYVDVNPLGIDFGFIRLGSSVTKRVALRNTGKELLHWKAALQKQRMSLWGTVAEKGRYISLENRSVTGTDNYVPSDYLQKTLSLNGQWSEKGGYPYSINERNRMTFNFHGSGIAVLTENNIDGGVLACWIDDKFTGYIDCKSPVNEIADTIITKNLSEDIHTATFEVKEKAVILKAFRVYTKDIMQSRKSWVKIYPEKGTIQSETDYVNIMIDSEGLEPGIYSENVFFNANGVNKIVELSFIVKEDSDTQLLEVYRYTRESDIMLVSEIQLENNDIDDHYENDGLTFNLYRKNTPGTVEFYCWYNPYTQIHYYSYDRSGEKSLNDFQFKGSIGNISTVKLPQTRELYRWYNPSTGGYFYTTDSKGEGREKRGYRYDGIAGYVR